MKKSVLLYLLATVSLFTISALFTSCDTTMGPQNENSAGKTNELIVVVNKASLMRTPLADSVKSFFEQEQQWLPQPEPFLEVTTIPEKQFKSSGFMKKHHNIFMITIDASIAKSFVETRENLWSIPQRVIKINASSDTAFYRLFNEYKETAKLMYDQIEIDRTKKTMTISVDPQLSAMVREDFSMNMSIPGGFSLSERDTNFIWFTQQIVRTKQEVSVGLLIYQYPYKTESSFEPEHIIHYRDSICKEYVSGPTPSSYMKTAVNYIPPQVKATNRYVTDFAVETRGLWELEGDFMGGPFISYSFVNPLTQMVVTAEGYVYNPNNKKSVYLRQLQATLHSVSFPEKLEE